MEALCSENGTTSKVHCHATTRRVIIKRMLAQFTQIRKQPADEDDDGSLERDAIIGPQQRQKLLLVVDDCSLPQQTSESDSITPKGTAVR